MPERYPDPSSPQYTSVIDTKSYDRLRATLEDARSKGAEVVPLIPTASFDDQLRKIPPHLILGATDDMVVMQNEIFGPLLPVRTYNSLDDFYTAARGGTVSLNRYQLAYVNLPGLDKPLQQLDPWYVGGYAQDQWRLRDNLTLTAGLRVDTPSFEATGFDNPNANALTFRDEDGNAVQYQSGKLPGSKPLWSPRLGSSTYSVTSRSPIRSSNAAIASSTEIAFARPPPRL